MNKVRITVFKPPLVLIQEDSSYFNALVSLEYQLFIKALKSHFQDFLQLVTRKSNKS